MSNSPCGYIQTLDRNYHPAGNAKTLDTVIGQSKEGTSNTDCRVWGSQSNDLENGRGTPEKGNGASFSIVCSPSEKQGQFRYWSNYNRNAFKVFDQKVAREFPSRGPES